MFPDPSHVTALLLGSPLTEGGDKVWGKLEEEEEAAKGSEAVEVETEMVVVFVVVRGHNGKEEGLTPDVCLRRRMDQHCGTISYAGGGVGSCRSIHSASEESEESLFRLPVACSLPPRVSEASTADVICEAVRIRKP